MPVGNFTENTSEVSSNSKVSSILQVLNGQWLYSTIYAAPVNIITYNKVVGSPSMVSSACTILANSTAKFCHRHNGYIILESWSHIIPEGGNAAAEVIGVA